MSVPDEFAPDVVAARSLPDHQMYRTERSLLLEPMKSFLENNPEVYFVRWSSVASNTTTHHTQNPAY